MVAQQQRRVSEYHPNSRINSKYTWWFSSARGCTRARPTIVLQLHESRVRAYTHGARPCGARQRPVIKSTRAHPRNPDPVTRPTRTGTARTDHDTLRQSPTMCRRGQLCDNAFDGSTITLCTHSLCVMVRAIRPIATTVISIIARAPVAAERVGCRTMDARSDHARVITSVLQRCESARDTIL